MTAPKVASYRLMPRRILELEGNIDQLKIILLVTLTLLFCIGALLTGVGFYVSVENWDFNIAFGLQPAILFACLISPLVMICAYCQWVFRLISAMEKNAGNSGSMAYDGDEGDSISSADSK